MGDSQYHNLSWKLGVCILYIQNLHALSCSFSSDCVRSHHGVPVMYLLQQSSLLQTAHWGGSRQSPLTILLLLHNPEGAHCCVPVGVAYLQSTPCSWSAAQPPEQIIRRAASDRMLSWTSSCCCLLSRHCCQGHCCKGTAVMGTAVIALDRCVVELQRASQLTWGVHRCHWMPWTCSMSAFCTPKGRWRL